jgi:rod shape-determining protein MreC
MVTYQRDSRQRSVLFVLVFTCLLLITLDSRGNGNGMVNSFRDVAQNVLAPVRNVVNDAFTPLQDLTGGITNYGTVKDENARLKREVANLQGRIQRERAVGSEVGELEKLLDLPTIEDATGVAARVVGGSPGNFQRTVEINKGTASGVFVGQPVVAGNGLVGKITQASNTLATVTLMDDPSIGIGVRLEKSNVRGITEGRPGERDMRLNFLSSNLSKCQKNQTSPCLGIGEFVFTASTADAAFPPDIPVAKILKVTRTNTDLESTVVLQPLVNLDDLTYVKVLRWPPPKGG